MILVGKKKMKKMEKSDGAWLKTFNLMINRLM
jgi:hypothetical protein